MSSWILKKLGVGRNEKGIVFASGSVEAIVLKIEESLALEIASDFDLVSFHQGKELTDEVHMGTGVDVYGPEENWRATGL